MSSNAPNRKTVRTALYDLLEPLSDGDYVHTVYNGIPTKDTFTTQSPVIIVSSQGSARAGMMLGSTQNNNLFTVAVSTWVARESSNADDLLDDIEKLVTDLVSDNRSGDDWAAIYGDEDASEISPGANENGKSYWVEYREFVIQKY